MTPESLFGILYAVVAARHLAQRGDDGGAAIAVDNVGRASDRPERRAAFDPVERTPECPAALGRELACVPTDRYQTRPKTPFLDAGASSNATDQCPEAREIPFPDADAPSPSGCATLRRQLCRASRSSTVFVTDASADASADGDDAAPPPAGGALVELYAPDSRYATPAILTGPYENTPDIKYHLKSATTNGRPARVDPEFIHAYEVYEDGTRASCNAGGATRPCMIESHIVRGGGVIMYDVSLLGEENEERQNVLFSRVQRVRGPRSGATDVF